MKTVVTFREAYQAYLAKGKIEAEGISSILVDEYQEVTHLFLSELSSYLFVSIDIH